MLTDIYILDSAFTNIYIVNGQVTFVNLGQDTTSKQMRSPVTAPGGRAYYVCAL